MTPKEKAKELVNKYFLEIEGADTYAFNLPSMNLFIAKKCVLIAVDEIKEVVRELCDEETIGIHMIYWEKVKQEIEKL